MSQTISSNVVQDRTPEDERMALIANNLADHLEGIKEMMEAYSRFQGMADDELESIYTLAESLYAKGNFEYAEQVYFKLTLFGTEQERFWLGLGRSRKKLKKYQGAIDAITMATMMSPENGEYWFEMAQCWFVLRKYEDAALMIEKALIYLATDHVLRGAAERLAQSLQSKLSEEG